MKHILTTTILFATACLAQAKEKSITEKARNTARAVVEKTKEVAHKTEDVVVGAAHHAGRAARAAWAKTKAFASDELPVYRDGANATLTSLAREIVELKARTPNMAPAYFRTRIQSLDEQHEDLTTRLALLSPAQLKDRSSGPRYEFDQCVGDLEQAIDQANDGLGTLSKADVR